MRATWQTRAREKKTSVWSVLFELRENELDVPGGGFAHHDLELGELDVNGVVVLAEKDLSMTRQTDVATACDRR